jgi:D-alanyl-D-alanine carboxypeptidase
MRTDEMARQRSLAFRVLVLLMVPAGIQFLAGCSGTDDPRITSTDLGSTDAAVGLDTADYGPSDVAPDGSGDLGDDSTAELPPDHGYQPVDPVLAASYQVLLDEYLAFSGEHNASMTILLPGPARWSGVSGIRDIRAGDPMPPGAAFRVGSSTKPVISTLILLAVEDGLLGLDDTLATWLPRYPQWKDVTVRHLLGMRSGIQDYLFDQALWLEMMQDPRRTLTPDHLLSQVKDRPLVFQPGTNCLYSNTNYILAGLVLEAATGRLVQDEIRDRIVEPLGLTHTYLDINGDPDPLLAHGYMDPKPAFMALGIPPDLVALIPQELFLEDDILDCGYLFHPSVAWTAGALVTTTDDMARFIRALVRGELVSRELLDQMMQFPECTLLGQPTKYGLGLSQMQLGDRTAYGHGGLIYGYSANNVHVPEDDFTYSSMHGAYPAQLHGIISEAGRLALKPPATAPVACEVPGDMFGGDSDRLEIRFRGLVNTQASASPAPAIANLSAWMSGTRHPLFGTWTWGKFNPNPVFPRIEIESYGPPRISGASVGAAFVTMAPAVLADLPGDGMLYLDASTPYQVIALVMDIWMTPAGEAERFCVAAVPDLFRPGSRLSFCDPATFEGKAGEMLRLFGSVTLTSDDEAIENYLKPIQIPRCTCPGPDGVWGPCDDIANPATSLPVVDPRPWMPGMPLPNLPVRPVLPGSFNQW